MKRLEKLIEYGFYIFIFFLPWQTGLIWRQAFLNGFVWEYGRFILFGSEIWLGLVLILFAFWLFKTRPVKFIGGKIFISRLKESQVLIYWLIVAFCLWAGLSILWSLDFSLAYNRWLILLAGVSALVLILNFKLSFKKFALTWVAAGAVQGIFAIWQFFVQYTPANKWLGLASHWPSVSGSIILQTNSERWLRAYGSLPHPNILAGFLVVAYLFLLYLALEAKNLKARIFIFFSLICIVPALFFTFCRSAWLALIVGLVVLIFWVLRQKDFFYRRIFWRWFFLTVLIFVILGTMFSELVTTRLTADQNLEMASLTMRLTFNKQAEQLIWLRPWGGVGLGNYTLGVYQLVNNTWPGFYYQPVHNIYLLAWAELGFVGAIIFYSILFLLLRFSLKKIKNLESLVIFLSLLAILIISIFDHYFWTMYFGVIIFWLVIGLNLKLLKQ